MLVTFLLLGALVLMGAVAAVTLRNLVHCALALAAALSGLASLYLQLGAQFVGLAQLLVYVGAVAILIVFAILLTRGGESSRQAVFGANWGAGVGVALVVSGVLAGVVLSSRALPAVPAAPATATVKQLGEQLMTKYILPLEVIGLLLTVALIGAVIIAMRERSTE